MSEQIALFFFFPPHFRIQIRHPFSRLSPAAKAANCKMARFSIMFPFATVLFKSDRFLTPLFTLISRSERAQQASCQIHLQNSHTVPADARWDEIDFRITVNRAEQHCQWNTTPDTREEHVDSCPLVLWKLFTLTDNYASSLAVSVEVKDCRFSFYCHGNRARSGSVFCTRWTF